MKKYLISLLFKMLGNSHLQVYNIGYLFGASTASHNLRKAKWQKALARLYKDKDLLDFLYYQIESDKENVFRGKINADLSKGARIRTLFLVYSARKAYEEMRKLKRSSASEKSEIDSEIQAVTKSYKTLTDIEETEN